MINCVVVVLAGGLGTRIRHLLPDLPKPLAPIMGHPFLEWVLRFVSRQGLHNIVVSAGYLAEKIEIFLASMKNLDLEIQCVIENAPLGTAGGVIHALSKCRSDFQTVLVLNGDSLILTDFKPLFNSLLSNILVDAAVIGVEVEDAHRYGTLDVGGDDFLLGFKEKKPGAGLINAGVYLFRKEILSSLPQDRVLSFETDIFPMLLAQKLQIKVIRSHAPFIDIGTEDSLGEASRFIQKNHQFF